MKLQSVAKRFAHQLKTAQSAQEELESFVAEEVDFAMGTIRHALSVLAHGNSEQAKHSLELALHSLKRVQDHLPSQAPGMNVLNAEAANFLAEPPKSKP